VKKHVTRDKSHPGKRKDPESKSPPRTRLRFKPTK
jgi:hypothetical protein